MILVILNWPKYSLRLEYCCTYLIATPDQSGNPFFPAIMHLIASLMVNSSWIFKRRRGRWQTRNTIINPMNITAILSSFFRLDSLTEIAAGGFLFLFLPSLESPFSFPMFDVEPSFERFVKIFINLPLCKLATMRAFQPGAVVFSFSSRVSFPFWAIRSMDSPSKYKNW